MTERTPRHVHNCSNFDNGCANFYVCRDRDCRDDWTCPTCEDNQRDEWVSDQERQAQARVTAEDRHVAQ